MAQPFKFKHQNEIVGAFVIAAVLTLFTAFIVLVRGQTWFEETIEITAVFEGRGIGLLRPGVPVRVRNNTIGRVKEAHHETATRTDVKLFINVEDVANVNADSTGVLYVPFAGLPGEPFIEIKPGDSHDSIRPGGKIHCRVAPDILQLAVDVLDDVHRDLTPTFKELTKLSANLNRLIALVETSGQVEKNLARVEKLSDGITRLLGKVEGLLETTTGTLGNVDKLIAKADHGDGLVARALNDKQIYGQLVAALGKMHGSMLTVERLLARADQAGKVLPHMAKLGVTALEDMVAVSKELKRLAPMMPGMVGQVDEVLFESRAIIEQAERHWLIGSYLKPSAQQPLLVPSGIRDKPTNTPLSQLRRELGPSESNVKKAAASEAVVTRPGGPNKPNP